MADEKDIRIVTTKSGLQVMVDAADYHLIAGRAVQPMRSKNGRDYYANVWRDGKSVLLHRLIMSPSAEEVVDHINGNPLDNRRANLRICTRAENLRNAKTRRHSASGIKGVYAVTLQNGGNRYRASIRANNIRIHLGTFDTAEQAHSAYCRAATFLHGEFARFA